MSWGKFLVIVVLLQFEPIWSTFESPNLDSCEPIKGECSDQGYTHTKIESVTHSFSSQQAADSKIKSFEILAPCSKYLKIFLCAAYKPSCYSEGAANLLIRPCQSLCNHVYTRCYPLMQKFKRKWSPELNCSRFLADSSQRCMNDPNGYPRDLERTDNDRVHQQIDLLFDQVDVSPTTTPTATSTRQSSKKLICRGDNRLGNKTACFVRCDFDNEFESGQKQIARLLALVLNVLTIVSSCITVLVYFVKMKQTNYNWFIYSSFLIVGHSLAQTLALMMGVESIGCEKLHDTMNTIISSQQPFENPYCSISFLFGHYFSTSLFVRWFTISLYWFIIVKRQVDPRELTGSLRHYLSSFAVISPVVPTVILLLLRYTEVSELSGLCTLGVVDPDMAFKFIIFPSSVFSILGLLFILAGFRKILAFRIRQSNNQAKYASYLGRG